MISISSSLVQAQRRTDERDKLLERLDYVADMGVPHGPLCRDVAAMLRADAEQLRARDEEIAWLRAKAAELMACFNAMKKCYEESDADCAALLVRIEELKNEMS